MSDAMMLRLLGAPLPDFLLFFAFALIGTYLSLQHGANRRRVDSTSSPIAFSYAHLLQDNLSRIVFNLVLIFVALRFSNELFGLQLNEWSSIMVGFGFDKIAAQLKRKGALPKKK